MSPPAQNALSPAPMISTARTSGSAAWLSSTLRSSPIISIDSAFIAAGRFRVTNATWLRVSFKTSTERLSLQTDGGVHSGGDAAVVEPARGDGFGLGVELHHLFAVRTQVAELGAARSGKAEVGHGHGNRHVDPHLAHVDFILKYARHRAALRENARAVAEGVVIDERDGFGQGLHADDD